MKKIFRFSVIVSLVAAMVSLTACQDKELDVDPLGESFSFNGMAPNPVMRGGALRIFGRGLDKVSEVRFAGDVSVTEFVKVSKGAKLDTLEVLVPVEGPLVGKVTIVGENGKTLSSLSDLTFTEPISIESFSPATVLSGDVLVFKGEYLNDVKEVIFSGDNAVAIVFEEQSRHELKVKVPANAITGPVILSDVNEIEDENTIPNHIYTATDLVVGKPTVTKAAKKTYKSGDVITVSGAHLDMIKNVALPQVSEVAFTLGEGATSISFNLVPKASDGNILLTSFAGDEFDAGEIVTVSVTDLTVTSKADDGRFKAGVDVEIVGTDLDLVTKVEFTGAEASWYLDGKKIIATQPDAAKDGPVTVTLDSGKQAYSEDLEVVKPIIIAWDSTDELVAGESVLKVIGKDLDLVESVKMGNKTQGFIDCAFEFVLDDLGNTDVKVSIPEQAYSGPVIFTSAAGYETETLDLAVTYNMAVTVKFDAPSYGLGQNISITGKNLLQVDQVYVKGKRVTSFAQRADDAMSFAIPDGIGPGVYRLAFVLMDGSEMTWPVPFEITAPFTETFIWEGYEDLGEWNNQPYLGAEGAFTEAGIVEGDIVRVYFTPLADDWMFQAYAGHWDKLALDELGGGSDISADTCDASVGYFAFNVTAQVLAQLTDVQGWGGSWTCNGQHVAITGLSLIHFGAAEKRTSIWEGSVTVGNWDGSMSALSWGGYDWSTVQAGTKLAVAFTATDDNAVMRFGNGSWASLPSLAGLATDGNIPVAGLTSYEFELTDADLAELVNNGGLVICGAYWVITEVDLVTMEGAGPVENAIWEGNSTVTWSGGAVTDLSWGGYDWSTVAAGTILCAHYTIDDPEGCIRFGNGSWASIPSLAGLAADGNLPLQEGGHEVELTQADLDELVANGGLVVCGTGFTITQIGLK